MASRFQTTINQVEGLFRDFRSAKEPEFLKLSPLVDSDPNGNFLVSKTVAKLDRRNAPAYSGDFADFKLSNYELDYVRFNIPKLDGLGQPVTHAQLAAIESGQGDVNFLETLVDAVGIPVIGAMTDNFLAEATSALSAPSAGAPNIASGSANIQEIIDGAKEDIRKDTGMYPTHLMIGPAVANQLKQLDQIQSQTAIAGAPSNGIFRRTGASSWDHVKAWFREYCQIELVVDYGIATDTDGSNVDLVGNTGILVHSQPGSRPGAFKTFNQTNIDDGADLMAGFVRVDIVENKDGLGFRGYYVRGNAYTKVVAVAPELGRKLEFTIS